MVKFQNIEIVGWFIWWTIRNVEITRQAFEALLAKVGLKYSPKEASNRSSFLKAIARVQGEEKKEGLLLRKIKARGKEYVYGLVDERVDTSEHLHYHHECNMHFFVDTGSMICDNATHRAYQLVLKYYDHYQLTMDSDDVREVIKRMLTDTYAVSVRDRGGIYFVPGKFGEVIEALEKVIAGLGSECYLAMAPQIDEERTKKSIYRAFVEGLKERIEDFRQRLEDNLSDGVRKNAARKNEALVNRLSEYKDMRKEIEFYADALDFQAGSLREELEGLGARLEKKLAE
jgi:hypothetical protein